VVIADTGGFLEFLLQSYFTKPAIVTFRSKATITFLLAFGVPRNAAFVVSPRVRKAHSKIRELLLTNITPRTFRELDTQTLRIIRCNHLIIVMATIPFHASGMKFITEITPPFEITDIYVHIPIIEVVHCAVALLRDRWSMLHAGIYEVGFRGNPVFDYVAAPIE
jgi:hypothetical protein